MFGVLTLISILLQVLYWLIIARAVASFVIRDWSSGIPRLLWDFTEPILAPVRRVIPPMAGLDFSPLIVIIVLVVIQQYLVRY